MQRLAVGMLFLLASATAHTASWETSSFRTTRGDLVRTGMTRAEVVKSAGEPLSKTVISQGVSLDDKSGETREAWTYRTTDGTYTLTFTGTRLDKIEVVPARQ
jgi:hypothetical protein